MPCRRKSRRHAIEEAARQVFEGSDADRATLPFRFTGSIDKITFKLGPTQLTSAEQKAIQQQLAKAKD